MAQAGDKVVSFESIFAACRSRWLTKTEVYESHPVYMPVSHVLYICINIYMSHSTKVIFYLQNFEARGMTISDRVPSTPPESGSLLVYDKNSTRRWRNDGYEWCTRNERHEKLKVDGVKAISCTYAKATNASMNFTHSLSMSQFLNPCFAALCVG